jgi:MFS family permease
MLAIPCGMIADRFGRTKTLLAGVSLTLLFFPSLLLAKTFTHVLVIRLGVDLGGRRIIKKSTALMADSIPRDLRGRMMAAIGRGQVLVGSVGGGTGGPGMGYLFTIPVMIASVVGGLLYSLNPTYPWLCIFGSTIIQLISVVLFIRDPQRAER